MIKAITDPDPRQAASSQAKGIVASGYRIAPAVARARRWSVVPVESAAHFDEDDARRIAGACGRIDQVECLAVATERLELERMCYRVPLTPSGLLAFSHECGHFNYVLFPADESFSILCTVKDYYLVAGSPEFVTDAVGQSVEAARSDFMRFANDDFWLPPERKALLRIAAEYAVFDEA